MSEKFQNASEVLDSLRLRFSSGNAVRIDSVRLTREEFHAICEGFCNWTGREVIPPRTTYGMWLGLQEAQELLDRTKANMHERHLRLGR
jgi:hypothetical protein